MSRLSNKYKKMERHFHAILPPGLHNRIGSLIAKEKAAFHWSTRQKHKLSREMSATIKYLLKYVKSTQSPWEMKIPLIIPRSWNIVSWGDACTDLGGGGHCPTFKFWFDVMWSGRVRDGTKLKSGTHGYVHINSLEFIVHIIMLAALITIFEDPSDQALAEAFPTGVPHFPVWLGYTDNMVAKSWENRATSSSPQGQSLLSVYSALLERAQLHTRAEHVPGVDNVLADDISRNDFCLPCYSRLHKLSVKHPFLPSYRHFQLSQELAQLLCSKLFSGPEPVPTKLPSRLGQLRHVSSTTLDLQWI